MNLDRLPMRAFLREIQPNYGKRKKYFNKLMGAAMSNKKSFNLED